MKYGLGYWVRSSHTGKGIATAAVRMAAHSGFNESGFTWLEIVAVVDNTDVPLLLTASADNTN